MYIHRVLTYVCTNRNRESGVVVVVGGVGTPNVENRDDTTPGTTWLRTTCHACTPNHVVIGVWKCLAMAHEDRIPGAVKVGDTITDMDILL